MSHLTDRSDEGQCCGDDADDEWGRVPGALPPIRWWLPVAVFAVAAFILTLLIVVMIADPGPLDDPDAADQRDGLLLDGPQLRDRIGGVEFGGRRIVVLFERTEPTGADFFAWRRAVADDGVELVIAVAGSAEAAELADAVNIPTPVDGGPPVGYAVIDSDRMVRYSTLDPVYYRNAFEVDVITGAVT